MKFQAVRAFLVVSIVGAIVFVPITARATSSSPGLFERPYDGVDDAHGAIDVGLARATNDDGDATLAGTAAGSVEIIARSSGLAGAIMGATSIGAGHGFVPIDGHVGAGIGYALDPVTLLLIAHGGGDGIAGTIFETRGSPYYGSELRFIVGTGETWEITVGAMVLRRLEHDELRLFARIRVGRVFFSGTYDGFRDGPRWGGAAIGIGFW